LTRNILHVTNGDAFAAVLNNSRIEGEIVPYREVLHEGPCQLQNSPEQWILSRAEYLSTLLPSISVNSIQAASSRFEAVIQSASRYEIVCLWFEHDLYDQLMLIRLLWLFSRISISPEKLQLICINTHSEIPRFLGLGQLSPAQALSLWDTQRQEVNINQISLGKKAWEAYCCEDPNDWEILLEEDTSILPFLKKAIRRHLQQFPSAFNGVCRTESLILKALYQEPLSAASLFQATNQMEEAPFMGDTIFFNNYLLGLLNPPYPLIKGAPYFSRRPEISFETLWKTQAPFQLTLHGEKVLMEKENWLDLKGGIDTWRGGVHLSGTQSPWYWHESLGCLLKEKKTLSEIR